MGTDNWAQWVIGGIATLGVGAYWFLSAQISALKRDYVRRDDLQLFFNPLRDEIKEILAEVKSARSRIHDVANEVARLQGLLQAHGVQGVDT